MPTAISKPVMAPHDPVPFMIPQELLSAVPMISSSLTRLPPELLLIIFDHIEDPIDQLCLALACRYLLQISSFLVIDIPSISKHRYLPPPFCDRMFLLLRRLAPPEARGRRRKRTLALCCDCLRYQSKKKIYWKKYGKRNAIAKSETRSWDRGVWWWTEGSSFQCPACYAGLKRE